MADHLPPAPPEAMPPVEWDGRVSLPARWYETGEFGTLRIPHEDWGKWDERLWVDDQVYGWNGLYYERVGEGHPLPAPLLYSNGNRQSYVDANWEPGQPVPTTLPARRFKDRQPRYLDTKRNVYVTAAQMESDKTGFWGFVGGVIVVCVYGVFVLGFLAMILTFLWWLIIPLGLIAGIVKLVSAKSR